MNRICYKVVASDACLIAVACRAVISGVIVLLNIILKQLLQGLVRFEKHWSQSDQEKAYAILAFVSQLLNSVLVLLLVNARSSIASNTINSTLSNNEKTSWCVFILIPACHSSLHSRLAWQ
jgi:hypothetical protein